LLKKKKWHINWLRGDLGAPKKNETGKICRVNMGEEAERKKKKGSRESGFTKTR